MKLFLPSHHADRTAPSEFRDAVETWARQFGGHGDVVWCPDPINAWAVRLSLKPGDPRLKHPDESTHLEQVILHEWVDPRKPHPLRGKCRRRNAKNQLVPQYVALELDDLGIQGLLEILDKGSVLTGRGEFKNAQEALAVVRDRNHRTNAQRQADARELALDITRSTRRRRLKIPFLPVAIDLSSRREGVAP